MHGYGLQICRVAAFLKCVKKEKKRKRGSLSNGQISKKPVHIGIKIIFIVGQRKVSTGRQLQSSRTWILVLINFYWLTYTKKSKTKWAMLKYRNNASESKGEKSPKPLILVCFPFVCIKMYVINFFKWNVPLH